jgi:hypothetical protein
MTATLMPIILGVPAVDFRLLATNGRTYTFDDVAAEKGTVIVFICNHCPYVIAVIDRLVADARVLMAERIGFAAICSNDSSSYPPRAWILRWQLVVIFEPIAPDEIAFGRHRPLLVLGREHQAADLGLDPIQDLLAFPGRMQDVAGAPNLPGPIGMTLSSMAASRPCRSQVGHGLGGAKLVAVNSIWVMALRLRAP